MDIQSGWLKKSLDEAEANVRQWPEWKRTLELAITKLLVR